MDDAQEELIKQKRKEAAHWTLEFQAAVAKNDLARILALSMTLVKVLADSANALEQISFRVSNQLQHLRIRAHALERLTVWLIVLTTILAFTTVPLSIESSIHLIQARKATGDKRQHEMFEGYGRCVSQLDENAAVNGYGAAWAKARQDCARFWLAKP
jgi:hypothetical protein